MRRNIKSTKESVIDFYRYYILYCFTYCLFYIHSFKKKVFTLVGAVEGVQKDRILYITLIVYLLSFLYKRFSLSKNSNEMLKKRLEQGFYILLVLILLVYSQIKYEFVHLGIYIWESCFFYFFGAIGLLLPLLFWNQLFFLLALLIILIVGKLFFYIGLDDQLLLGYLYTFSFKQWIFLFLSLITYIVTTAGLDILKTYDRSKNTKTTASDIFEEELNEGHIINYKEVTNSKSKKENISRKILFTEEIIDSIYDTKNNFGDGIVETESAIDQLGTKLLKVLGNFSIHGEMYKQLKSYTVSNYFFKPQAGTKMSRIESVEEELSMEIGRNIRVTSSLQGVIFEVANEKNIGFSFKDIWEQSPTEELPLFIGFDSLGQRVILDLAKQPHILMCGTTGSGKSSTLQCLIHSLITSKSLDDFQFLFIDPKVLELSVYKSLPNLFCPIVTNLDSASQVLANLVEEMENRYKTISRANQRSIKEYNRKMEKEKLPYLVCVIEEFADLALMKPTIEQQKNNNFKNSVQRLAQMGRAAGIHLIIATQRPSVNVIDGVIKANFPTRIGLKVANKMESRIILDQSGAERMGGPGEMILLDASGISRRVIAPYISEEEIERLMAYIQTY